MYQRLFDDPIKQCKVSGSAVADLLVRTPLKERLDACYVDAKNVRALNYFKKHAWYLWLAGL